MNLYEYNGPVIVFDKCITNNWKASTYAVSEKKARSNLAHQFKQQTNRVARTKVELPGKLTMIG